MNEPVSGLYRLVMDYGKARASANHVRAQEALDGIRRIVFGQRWECEDCWAVFVMESHPPEAMEDATCPYCASLDVFRTEAAPTDTEAST